MEDEPAAPVGKIVNGIPVVETEHLPLGQYIIGNSPPLGQVIFAGTGPSTTKEWTYDPLYNRWYMGCTRTTINQEDMPNELTPQTPRRETP